MKIKNYALSILIFSMLFGIFAPVSLLAQTDPGGYVDPTTGINTVTGEFVNQQVGSCGSFDGLGKIICQVHQILNAIVPLLLALGVVYFVWGVVRYMIGGDEEAKKKGRDKIVYGIIGLAVIMSVWGLVAVLVNTFGLAEQDVSSSTLTLTQGNFNQSLISCDIGTNPRLQHVLSYATCVINRSVIPLIFSLATVIFLWGVVQYVINGDDEAKKTKGKQFMLWGIIALTVMVSVWGLVAILNNTFGIENVIPQVKP